MSTELDEAKLWYATAPDFDSYPEMLDAFHKHMIALASLPQQDVGAGRYKPVKQRFSLTRWNIEGPTKVEGWFPYEADAQGYCDALNAAFAAGRSVPSPVGHEPTVEQVMKAVNEWADHEPHVGRYSATKQGDLRARLSSLFTHPPKAGVLTDEPLFTEAQVKAMLRDVIAATSYDEPHGTYRTNELVAEVADRHGLKQP